MSLETCPECGGTWSSDSNTCPHCGHRRECGNCCHKIIYEESFDECCELGRPLYRCDRFEWKYYDD